MNDCIYHRIHTKKIESQSVPASAMRVIRVQCCAHKHSPFTPEQARRGIGVTDALACKGVVASCPIAVDDIIDYAPLHQ